MATASVSGAGRNPKTGVAVVGAGVSGLSCALRLLQRGAQVVVFAREFPLRTVSAVAGAIWYPYEARPPEKVERWGRASLVEFERLARVPGSGVTIVEGLVADRGETRRLPVAEMPIYLQFLVGELQRLGGRLVHRDLRSLAELDAPAIVDCAGLGARELAGDQGLYPIRGQVVQVDKVTDRFVIDDGNPRGMTYVIPRARDCVLGGVAQKDDADLRPRAAETAAIRARCAEHVPALQGADTRAVLVGLRPGRREVRLESERLPDGRLVIHDYGHGGAGMTLSWGCADEVADLVAATAG